MGLRMILRKILNLGTPKMVQKNQYEESLHDRYIRLFHCVSGFIPTTLLTPNELSLVEERNTKNKMIKDEVLRIYPVLRIFCKPLDSSLFYRGSLLREEVDNFLLRDNVLSIEQYLRDYYDELLDKVVEDVTSHEPNKKSIWCWNRPKQPRHQYANANLLIVAEQRGLVTLTKNEKKALKALTRQAFTGAITE